MMDLSIKSSILYAAIILTGLSAGFFYAWMVSVIPGIRKVPDLTYLESMQSINREILNPLFFITFFGSPILLAITTFQHSGTSFWFLLASLATYVIGTFGVTALGNVPLNNWLDAMDLAELTARKMNGIRTAYESKWNRLHLIRTLFAIISFVIALVAVFSQQQHDHLSL